jgi:hypothetical protein
MPAHQLRESSMATNRVRSGRRRGAVALATSALLALAVSPAFAHSNVTSSNDARRELLEAEHVGAAPDEVDELDQLDEGDEGNVDEGDQGDQDEQGDRDAPRIPGGHVVEKQADKNDASDDQGEDNDDEADENDDHEESGDSDDADDSGESHDGGSGGDSEESGD